MNGELAMQHVPEGQANQLPYEAGQVVVHDVEAAAQGLEVGVQDYSEDDLVAADSGSLREAEEESRPEHQNVSSRTSTPLAIQEVGSCDGGQLVIEDRTL